MNTRLQALTALNNVISALHDQLPDVPELDLPPPYDPSRIVLTHKQNAMVSDMAKGEHAPQWALWQKTHSSLTSQFLADKSGEDDAPNSKGDVERKVALNDYQVAAICGQVQMLLNGTSTSVFKRFSDTSEKCRELALKIAIKFCLSAPDLTKCIPFLIPSILSRYPSTYFDPEQNVFIHDMEKHEEFKRGVATERQDRASLVHGIKKIEVVEGSEEVRLMLCDVVGALLKSAVYNGTLGCLNPYFPDFVLILQSQLRDPFPILKCRSSLLLVQLMRIPQWEQGAMVFATAVARQSITNLRHRNAKVRIASLSLFEAAVGVPNRAKVRGAGTEAINDLVGFREENVLPVAAFYSSSCGVSVNSLASLCQDSNPTVRARICAVLCFFIVCLPDRYDHHVRLLPYVLSFFTDDIEDTRKMAVEAIDHCGQQYEAEHPDDVIERRQYGVDGSSKTNVGKNAPPLPTPFTTRPRLGARLFVRGNTKRFFKALLRELTNWISATRERSVVLLRSLVVYCEEHLTMDFAATLPLLVQALGKAEGEKGSDLPSIKLVADLEEVLKLTGRYVDPATYVPLLLSGLREEGEGVRGDTERRCNIDVLRCMTQGEQAVGRSYYVVGISSPILLLLITNNSLFYLLVRYGTAAHGRFACEANSAPRKGNYHNNCYGIVFGHKHQQGCAFESFAVLSYFIGADYGGWRREGWKRGANGSFQCHREAGRFECDMGKMLQALDFVSGRRKGGGCWGNNGPCQEGHGYFGEGNWQRGRLGSKGPLRLHKFANGGGLGDVGGRFFRAKYTRESLDCRGGARFR